MSNLSPLFQRMIEDSNNDPDVVRACENGEFYVVGIDCLNGVMSVGCSEDPDGNDMPNLYCKREDAFNEVQEEIDRYTEEIAEGERDEDDEYEGQLLAVKWDGQSKIMAVYDETIIANPPEEGSWRSTPMYEGDWRSMAGLEPEEELKGDYDNWQDGLSY